MTIIQIEPYANGAHENQTMYDVTPETFPIPDGWAVIPGSVGTPDTLENFPFGEIAVETIDGVPTVTGWTPLPMPEPEDVPESYSTDDLMGALLGR